MGYWKDKYGERSKDFVDGVIAGVEAYATWRDGTARVGCTETPLKKAIEEIKRDFAQESK